VWSLVYLTLSMMGRGHLSLLFYHSPEPLRASLGPLPWLCLGAKPYPPWGSFLDGPRGLSPGLRSPSPLLCSVGF
jgi:hypothetical protein